MPDGKRKYPNLPGFGREFERKWLPWHGWEWPAFGMPRKTREWRPYRERLGIGELPQWLWPTGKARVTEDPWAERMGWQPAPTIMPGEQTLGPKSPWGESPLGTPEEVERGQLEMSLMDLADRLGRVGLPRPDLRAAKNLSIEDLRDMVEYYARQLQEVLRTHAITEWQGRVQEPAIRAAEQRRTQTALNLRALEAERQQKAMQDLREWFRTMP